MKNKLALTLAAIAALTTASTTYAGGFNFDTPTLAGAGVGLVTAANPIIGLAVGGFVGNKLGEHERKQDAAIASTKEDVNTLGNYVASEPWKAKILAAQKEETAAPQETKLDWRKSIFPQGSGGLDMVAR